MATNRMDLVCTVCGEALELASYEPPANAADTTGGWAGSVNPAALDDWLDSHRHSASPLFGPACFTLAFDAEQEG